MAARSDNLPRPRHAWPSEVGRGKKGRTPGICDGTSLRYHSRCMSGSWTEARKVAVLRRQVKPSAAALGRNLSAQGLLLGPVVRRFGARGDLQGP